jgi:hypothetical protein
VRYLAAPIALLAILLVAVTALLWEHAIPRAVTWVTTTPAPWSYVEAAWGGVALGDPTVQGGRVSLPLKLDLHQRQRTDSAVCVRRVSARPEAGRIIVRFDKCICGPGTTSPYRCELEAHFARPSPGKYVVVYDDAGAGYPRIGEVELGE